MRQSLGHPNWMLCAVAAALPRSSPGEWPEADYYEGTHPKQRAVHDGSGASSDLRRGLHQRRPTVRYRNAQWVNQFQAL